MTSGTLRAGSTKLKERIYGTGSPEIKATRLVRERSLKSPQQKQMAEESIELLAGYQSLRVFAVVMERPREPLPEAPGNVGYHYFHILKRIHLHANQTYRTRRSESALVFFDERDAEQDRQMTAVMMRLLYGTHNLYRILEMPAFVDSSITVGVQLADLAAGVIRKYYEFGLDKRRPGNDFEAWVEGLYGGLAARTEDFREGPDLVYGIYTMSLATMVEHAERAARLAKA